MSTHGTDNHVIKIASNKETRVRAFMKEQQAGYGRLLLVRLLILSGLLVAAGFGQPSGAAAAQQRAITGEWRVDFDRGRPDLVSLTILWGDSFRGDGTRSDGPVALGELQGLTREQAFGQRQDVKFRIVREAGTFECEGTFSGGRGSGGWRLVPDEGFIAAMRSRGYSLASDKQIFESALFDVNLKALDALNSLGYTGIPFDKLIETRIFDITPELVEEMRAAGYSHPTLDELVEVRIFKVDRKYIEEVRALGFGHQPLRQLIEMRSQGVTPGYVREMRAAGFNLSPQELVDFKVFGVTSGFIREVRDEGLSPVSPRQFVDLKIYKIDADFIRRVRAKGFTNVTVDQLVDMRVNGLVK
jgi:hypothetical protein